MQYEHISGIITTQVVDGMYSMSHNGKYMGHILEAFIIEANGWTPEKKWRTLDGRCIPYSEVTHQHWSNIYHWASKGQKLDSIKTAKEQLNARFRGEILPAKNYLFTTDDGTPKYKGDVWYYNLGPETEFKVAYTTEDHQYDSVPKFHLQSNAYAKGIELLKERNFLFTTEDGHLAFEGVRGWAIIRTAYDSRRMECIPFTKEKNVEKWFYNEEYAKEFCKIILKTEDGYQKYAEEKVHLATKANDGTWSIWKDHIVLANAKFVNFQKAFHFEHNAISFVQTQNTQEQTYKSFLADANTLLHKYKDTTIPFDIIQKVFKLTQ